MGYVCVSLVPSLDIQHWDSQWGPIPTNIPPTRGASLLVRHNEPTHEAIEADRQASGAQPSQKGGEQAFAHDDKQDEATHQSQRIGEEEHEDNTNILTKLRSEILGYSWGKRSHENEEDYDSIQIPPEKNRTAYKRRGTHT